MLSHTVPMKLEAVSDFSVLLVEPDAQERMFMLRVLALLGVKAVSCAESGMDAGEWLCCNTCDLVVLRLTEEMLVLPKTISSRATRPKFLVIFDASEHVERFDRLAQAYDILIVRRLRVPFALADFGGAIVTQMSEQRYLAAGATLCVTH